MTDSTDGKLRNLRPFKPGAEWTGNANGRPKGSRNKLDECFVQALLADFQQHGAVAIVRCREEQPATYLQVIRKILPKQVEGHVQHEHDHFHTQSVSETAQWIESVLGPGQVRS